MRFIESSTPEWVSISAGDGCLMAATASIDAVGDQWWVSRVVVRPQYRRKQLGTRCLKRAIELVREQDGRPIVVAPGGYNIPYEEQVAFYRSCGFVLTDEHGLMEFKDEEGAPKDPRHSPG